MYNNIDSQAAAYNFRERDRETLSAQVMNWANN